MPFFMTFFLNIENITTINGIKSISKFNIELDEA